MNPNKHTLNFTVEVVNGVTVNALTVKSKAGLISLTAGTDRDL